MGIKSPKQPPENQNDRPSLSPLSDRELELHRHRYREARRSGMNWTDAKLFASSHIDIEEMRALARKGCQPELLLRILL